MSLLVLILIYRQLIHLIIMTDQEALDYYQKLETFYGRPLPDPDHEPKQFEYLVKLYRYDLRKNPDNFVYNTNQ